MRGSGPQDANKFGNSSRAQLSAVMAESGISRPTLSERQIVGLLRKVVKQSKVYVERELKLKLSATSPAGRAERGNLHMRPSPCGNIAFPHPQSGRASRYRPVRG